MDEVRPASAPGYPEGYLPLGDATVVARRPRSLRLQAGTATVEVVALAEGVFRVGLFGDGRPPEYPSFAVELPRGSPPAVQIAEAPAEVRLSTSAATVTIALAPLRLRFADASGRVIVADDPARGAGFLPRPGLPLAAPERSARVHLAHPHGTRYFACGERTGGLEKTGTHPVVWSTDPPNEHTPTLNALYTAIPFVLALQEGRSWGLFLDYAGRSEFDLAREAPDITWFGADTSTLVYYLCTGPTPRDVLAQYTALTGRTPMPPLWGLGYHQSRWSYESAAEVRALAAEFRRRDLPCDALYLDIDYMRGYRVFTWDPVRFPDPPGLLADLRAQGFRTVTIVDPGVKVDDNYAVYRQGRDAGLYCQAADGEEYRNVVWPGLCAFPDFTNPHTRDWWGANHESLLDAGVDGIWCDMNEPTVMIPRAGTFPPDVIHPGGGTTHQHAEVHNAYGSLMARAAYEGMRRLRPERRPLVISRAGYAGLQRHALHWTGDNSSWWEHLALSMPQLANLGLSGLAWAGVDVGGFNGDCSGELLTRWTEFGIFQPFCRNHASRGTRRQEPWAFGEPYESLLRALLQLRQRLLPYLYALFEECHRTGAPLLRPLLFAYPDDPTGYTLDDEFLVGDALLVAPIARSGVEYRHVYLPRGTWFHYWSGARIDGPAHVLARAPLGQPAIYVRGDTPLPLWPAMLHVGERPADPLTLLLFPAESSGETSLYEDAGDGYAHEQGGYWRVAARCTSTAERIVVELGAPEGHYRPPRRTIELELHGLPAAPAAVQANGQPASGALYADGRLRVPLPADALPARVEIVRGAPPAS